ncbi:hypothetical protein TNIN_170901 [Trichonephila inaurata madagascariensis]|uniref:Uncharacterized protein n=1 Tax=Trichonephila inaurata madagascariensis TaxID=2747483 RepID=A0A8X6XX24_9ARAC|nr:hypothetical protein TNIN_170901 [Trichonephila inaurata madagascariensis]
MPSSSLILGPRGCGKRISGESSQFVKGEQLWVYVLAEFGVKDMMRYGSFVKIAVPPPDGSVCSPIRF